MSKPLEREFPGGEDKEELEKIPSHPPNNCAVCHPHARMLHPSIGMPQEALQKPLAHEAYVKGS